MALISFYRSQGFNITNSFYFFKAQSQHKRQFQSLRVVEGFAIPFVLRSTVLPFKSNTYIKLEGSCSYAVFSISITCTYFMYSVLTVKTPKIFASSVFLFCLKWLLNFGRHERYKSNSVCVIVFMMYLRSCEQKKKDPERPAPSPDLNTESLLYFGLREE